MKPHAKFGLFENRRQYREDRIFLRFRMKSKYLDSRIVGVITARGGSRSVPKKNIALVGGKPLIVWTIEAALHSGVLDSLMVSTDDEEIANTARRWGAEVPFQRPAELARDESSQMSVMLHAIRWLERQKGCSPEYILLLQPTSPLRTKEDIQAAAQLAFEKAADSVVSVCLAHHHPYLTMGVADDGMLVDLFGNNPAHFNLRRQDTPPAYALNGAIFLTRRQVLLDQRTFYPARTFAYVMPPERSLDIDDSWDLHLANLIIDSRNASATS